MRVIASVCEYGSGESRFYLKPYVLVVPGFLPATREVAKDMIGDLGGAGDEYVSCEDAWVIDQDHPWPSADLHRVLDTSIDWGVIPSLEYNWEEKDSWGEIAHDPWKLWSDLGEIKKRAVDLEPFIVKDRRKSERYAKFLGKDQWEGFEPDDLVQNPCWMFYYAKNVCRGRLPDVLDNAMTMLSFQDADNPWIKRYFGTKRYRVRNRKALASISWAA